ncbi:PEP-CTERM sorting domain-containing protein [Colwelliaceae bacterium MEBiC 14330]
MKKLLNTIVALSLVVSTHSFAGIINGDFESGLTSWTTTNNVSTTSSALSGAQSAYVNNYSLSLSALDSFFGLTANTFSNSLDCSDEPCLEGSGLYQSVSYNAGDILSFDWMTTLENSSEYVDWVGFVVEGTVIQLGNGVNTADNTLFNTEYTFLNSGSSFFGFVVGDGGDGCCGSTMKIDNVAITSVPEPTHIALLGLGLAALGFSRRKVQG